MIPVTTLLQWGTLAAILIATWQIIKPFVGATLLAGILVASTWHLHDMIAKKIHRPGVRATLLISLWLIVLGVPTLWVGYMFTENATVWMNQIREYLTTHGFPPHLPDFIRKLPFVGQNLDSYWYRLTHNKDEVTNILSSIASPARNITWDGVQSLGNALVQMMLVLFIAWFMYFDGPRLAKWLSHIAYRLGDDLGVEMLKTTMNTVRAVMLGLIGSALGQSIIMAIGLSLAGVPQVGLLSAATFFLSLLPGGPALVWGGASIWLYSQNSIGWMIFLIGWGLLVVSSVDNFLKPILMSKGSNQSLLVITLGVFGGAIAFGFIGLFLGPVILGLVSSLLKVWLDEATTE